jgi:hypothetical protein
MFILKPGVSLSGVNSALIIAMMVAKDAMDNFDYDCCITSVVEGRHSYNSLHYSGCAFDIRVKEATTVGNAELILGRLIEALTNDFDVILEWGDGTAPHIHVEYQPGPINPRGIEP